MLTGNDEGTVSGKNFRPDFTLIFYSITDYQRGEYERGKVSGIFEKLLIISTEILI